MKLENKRILITGASSGIGKILTQELARGMGNRILAVARHTENIPNGRWNDTLNKKGRSYDRPFC